LNTREVSMMVVWTALYAVGLMMPFSQFIGGAGFITLSIVFIPVYNKMLKPVPAMIAGTFGMAIAVSFGAAIVPVYGIFSFAMPLVAGLLGSLAFHYRWGAVPGIIFLGICGYLYAAYSGGTLLWLVPYAVAIVAGFGAIILYNLRTHTTAWSNLPNHHHRECNHEPWKHIHTAPTRRSVDCNYSCIPYGADNCMVTCFRNLDCPLEPFQRKTRRTRLCLK